MNQLHTIFFSLRLLIYFMSAPMAFVSIYQGSIMDICYSLAEYEIAKAFPNEMAQGLRNIFYPQLQLPTYLDIDLYSTNYCTEQKDSNRL